MSNTNIPVRRNQTVSIYEPIFISSESLAIEQKQALVRKQRQEFIEVRFIHPTNSNKLTNLLNSHVK